MKVIVDECCSPLIAEALRENGHDVVYVAIDTPGMLDSEILSQSVAEENHRDGRP